MTPFTSLSSVAIPLLRDNVDTDAIIPSREMRSTGRTGLADGLFAPWRYLDVDARLPDPAFPLNDARSKGAQILLGGENFGCGSSREHAVWALAEWGIRAVIAPSFAPIFKANCLRNGLLPVELPAADLAWATVHIDLADEESFAASVVTGVKFGFQGKLLIHPAQVALTNSSFMPSEKEIARAQKIVDAFNAAENAGSASIKVDGYFVDYPIVEKAQQVLALAARL